MILTKIFLFFVGMITLFPALLHSSEVDEQPCHLSQVTTVMQNYLNSIDQHTINQDQFLCKIKKYLTCFKSSYEDGNALRFEYFATGVFDIEVDDSLIDIRDKLKSANNGIILIHNLLANPLDEYRYKLDQLLNKYSEATEEQKEFFSNEVVSLCEEIIENYPIFRLKIYQMIIIKNHLELVNKLSDSGITYTQEEIGIIKKSIEPQEIRGKNSIIIEKLNHNTYVFPLINISDLAAFSKKNTILCTDIDETLVRGSTILMDGEKTLKTFEGFHNRFAITARTYNAAMLERTYNQLKKLGLEFTEKDNLNCTFGRCSGFDRGIFYIPYNDYETKGDALYNVVDILRSYFPNIEKNLILFVDDTPSQVAKFIYQMKVFYPQIKCLGFLYVRPTKANKSPL